MHTQKVETLGPFSSHVIPIKMMETYLGECLNMMMQSLHVQDWYSATWLNGTKYVYRTEEG